ncbi:MAG: 16S rRNA (cytosine(1402)-N(4))-methyltransferase RsmH [Gemmatimonadetes bacterium]|nr:16S rRNA (cytosine(1402)-N(4))-methyltransferase RsmH [Gemmatimonadota bacterium]
MMEHDSAYHAPVMIGEVLDLLDPRPEGLYLDGTLGGGGHAEALLQREPRARLIAVDRDPDALREAGERLAVFGDRVRLVRANYSDATAAAGIGPEMLDGALLDLGISSHQVDEVARGFTFRAGAPLDMRMGQDSVAEATAAELLNTLGEEELATIFYRFGEERRSRRLARLIVERRAETPLKTSDDLVALIEAALTRPTAQDRARIFQALRIAVNREIEGIEAALPRLREALRSGGVLVVLSYHSLEDRVVKDSFRSWSQSCVCPPGFPVCSCRGEPLGETLTRKPLYPSDAEVARNPRARSARLRAWRRA